MTFGKHTLGVSVFGALRAMPSSSSRRAPRLVGDSGGGSDEIRAEKYVPASVYLSSLPTHAPFRRAYRCHTVGCRSAKIAAQCRKNGAGIVAQRRGGRKVGIKGEGTTGFLLVHRGKVVTRKHVYSNIGRLRPLPICLFLTLAMFGLRATSLELQQLAEV